MGIIKKEHREGYKTKIWKKLASSFKKLIHGNTNLKVQPNYYKDKMAEVPIWGVTVSNLILQLANFSVK